MKRIAVFVYGVVAYVLFFATFLYAIGFTGNLLVPKGIDSGTPADATNSVVINLLLLSAFALQHSIMARPAVKKLWAGAFPRAFERSTYVLLASLLLDLLFWQWRPLPQTIWGLSGSAGGGVLTAFFWVGWTTVLISTFMIGHFELFGFWQAWMYLTGRDLPQPAFGTPGIYRFVRHPIMLGFLIAFWATPVMSKGHLLFAAVTSAYILVAIRIEEHDLLAFFGDAYAQYRKNVRALLPLPRGK